ncbi:hypothetical protein PUN28_013963 [Cardiocondyla obscurior]|uniref:Uncharacterized protein n=1 Tax=Cardiocondyla obscurior TaxID=286306 RepID=A0AAW2F810_9HYME
MEKKERLRELFGSMSEESESPPASPPPGVWPSPIDPSRRYPAPRVGTWVQRGDGSQRAHTRWLEELPPAPPKTTRNRQNQPTGTTTTRKPPRKGTAVASKAAASSTVASAPPTVTASGPGGSREQERQPPGKGATTAGRINAATRDKSTARGTTMPSIPGNSGQRQGGLSTAPQPPKTTRYGSQEPPKPIFRSMKVVRPPRPEVPTVAGIERQPTTSEHPVQAFAQKHTRATETPSTTRAVAARGSMPPPATARNPAAAPGNAPAEVRATAEVAAISDARQTSATPLVLPLPPFAAAMSSRPPVTPPPAPPAYVVNKGWTARAGVPLQVPIQLPDEEIVQVPMSAIQQNRKYRARSATGRWVLRFAADGRLTLCRKVQKPAP